MPVRLIVTNDGDTPISLSQARIDFITASRETRSRRAQIEDIQRIINIPAECRRARFRLAPSHVGGVKAKNKNKQILADNQAYAYASIAIEPHTTRSGFLFL